MPTLHLLITGRVQGVFYRASAKDVADGIGITGWIKNTKDDCVVALISGSDEQTKQFIDWCKKGPKRAHVTNVIVTETADENFADFTVIR